ncbi:hypothetical protein U1Q18_027942, partial [Sarracenia purpurea var. burkii]
TQLRNPATLDNQHHHHSHSIVSHDRRRFSLPDVLSLDMASSPPPPNSSRPSLSIASGQEISKPEERKFTTS